MRHSSPLLMTLAIYCLTTLSFAQGAKITPMNDGRDDDRTAILKHIEGITQAFIDGDVQKIFDTHSTDWRGLLEGTDKPIKGVDEYMRANGIQWPWPAGKPKRTDWKHPANGFTIRDFDVAFYAPEIGVANFILDFEKREAGRSTLWRRLRIMDVYAKRKDGWMQVSSHTVTDPDWQRQQFQKMLTLATPLSDEDRLQILKDREAVWRAFFANDRAALEKLLPAELITIDAGTDQWSNRDSVMSAAADFAKSGGKLTRLEFPKTEIQVYAGGNVAIIYTTYSYELGHAGKKTTTKGRGTEIFVKRDGQWVNSGWHLDAGPSAQQ